MLTASFFHVPHFDHDRLTEIWQMTWPQLMMLFCQFVIGITDIWASGQISPDVQAAVGMATQCQMFFMALAMAAVSGVVACVSQSLGAEKITRARRYVCLVVLGGTGCGCLLAWLGHLGRTPILTFIQTPEPVLPLASLFFSALMWSLPGQYATTIGAAVFRSAKSVLKPLEVTILVCILNIFGDLAFGLGWWGFPAYGAKGLAWATFVSVTAGALVLIFLLFLAKLLTRDGIPSLRWIRAGMPYLIKVMIPAFGTSFLWQCGYLVLYIITATVPGNNVAAIAGLTSGLRVEAILFLPGIAFNMTASVLVGHALGMGDKNEAKRVALTILCVACAGMSCVGACLWPWRMDIALLLTNDLQVAREIASYLNYNILSVPFSVTSVVLAGTLNGAGATIYPMVAFSIAVWILRLPLAWFMGHLLWQDSSGVYCAMLISQMVQSSILLWVLLRCNWTRFAMHIAHSSH